MGCVSSKNVVPSSPPLDSAGVSGNLEGSSREVLAGSLWNRVNVDCSESGESGKMSSNGMGSTSFRLGNLYRYIEGEQAAAGWPTWLSSVAKEAIHGMVPLKAESFEKLEKIGQGTYSSVFKARDTSTGKLYALKKVRFDNFEPESVRFMSREILILRKLNHPNIVKLEGLITSRLSCSIYLVFEYMEHDLAGLSSAPDIKFSESQVKCYMHQLLSALDHCHSHGIMHRDIKCANLLVNNEGILKMADFGLANFFDLGHRKPLTSRVVTLWYRPPELLLGSTDYEATVDLWSVGCVFAELFVGKPILQGRTEVEQIHKIFKLCGSPPDEYWRKNKLPHATLFKPQQPYSNCLQNSFDYLPPSTFKLLETFLSLEAHKRSTANSALASEYFKSKPYACEPSSLPKYAPHKEIDAKSREEAHRRRVSSRERGSEHSRRSSRTQRTCSQVNAPNKLTAFPEGPWTKAYSTNENGRNQDGFRENVESRLFVDLQPLPTINFADEERISKQTPQEGCPFSGPLTLSGASGLMWARNQKGGHRRSVSRSSIREKTTCAPSDTSLIFRSKMNPELNVHAKVNGVDCEAEKQAMLQQWIQCEDSFISCPDVYHHRDDRSSKPSHMIPDYQAQANKLGLSGPILSQSQKVNELLGERELHIRQAVRKSWFQRGDGA